MNTGTTVTVSRVADMAELGAPPARGSVVVKCSLCGEACWQAPSTQALKDATIVCLHCLVPHVKSLHAQGVQTHATVLPGTVRELAEWVEDMQGRKPQE